ncbi:MAG: terminase large subunit [Pirellulaceae bacterium]
MRAYLERPRGHSKTTDLAVMAVWLLAFATRPLRGYSYAADRDQAALLRDAVDRIVRLNPWLAELICVDKDKVTNIAKDHPGRDSMLRIETSDVASSYGILPDFVIADEFTHWQGDGSLWNSIISSAAKRRTCLLVGISNAGFVDSWQWKIREAIRQDPAWYFSRVDGPQASWMSDGRLDEQERLLPNIAFRRLWQNEWSPSGGDALRPEDIEAAFRKELKPFIYREADWDFIAGVDLGLKRDCSAVVTLAVGRFVQSTPR